MGLCIYIKSSQGTILLSVYKTLINFWNNFLWAKKCKCFYVHVDNTTISFLFLSLWHTFASIFSFWTSKGSSSQVIQFRSTYEENILEPQFKMRINQGIKNLNQGLFVNEITNSSYSPYSWSYSYNLYSSSYSLQIIFSIREKRSIDRQSWLTFVYTQFTFWVLSNAQLHHSC